MIARVKATSNNGLVRIAYIWFPTWIAAEFHVAKLNRTFGTVCKWELI